MILFQGLSQVLLAFHTANNRFLLPQATHLLATGLVLLLLWQFLPTYGVPLLMIAWVSGYFIQDVILWLTLPTKLQLTWRLHLPVLKLFWSNLWPLALGAVI